MNLGYDFKNKKLLTLALTHSSYGNEKRCQCNERLEFLGDSVLSIIVSEYLFGKLPLVKEGELSKIRASLVCEQSLADFAKAIKIGDALLLGKGEDATGGRERASILSDAFEAIIAAIYLDSDFETVKKWVLNIMKKSLHLALDGRKTYHDYKTMLQEEVQKHANSVLYRVVEENGPDHRKNFVVEALMNGKRLSLGEGMSKKDAEQNAAKKALVDMGYEIL